MNGDVNNKTWLGALASAIKALASTLINLFSVANEGISMAQQAVEVAREKQAVDLTISMADYAQNALSIASVNQAKVREAVEEYVKADPSGARKKNVEEAHARLKGLVEQTLGKIKAERAVN